MNKDPFRDQADKLKQKIERVPEEPITKKKDPLPPRSELHREKKKKNKVKLKYPLISLLLLFFILMPLTVFSIYSYFDNRNEPLLFLSEETNEVEEVQYERAAEEEESGIVSEENPEAEQPSEEETTDSGEKEGIRHSADEGEGAKGDTKLPAAKAAEVKEPEKIEPAPEGNEEPSQETNSKVLYHTVQPSETIFRIAMKYYHSQDGIEIIKDANNLPNNEIQSGQVLKIPLSE
ncbi:LysM peptidoglycan-binding domain-containing protein [Bacillus sp. Marseille-Q1617]|uniref:LysM peptidoglycan-binding domain-containing protein n=1 Tax=Bacillus sp. Marseille-Q1617 TaxID=2736887 RepID=UPI00158D79AF|nr:LysM peptidoglycan-binding domain-containing protein [Bacillus sp. Marseille-Q1617]